MALAFSVFFVENTRHQIHRTVLQYLAAAHIEDTRKRHYGNVQQPRLTKLLLRLR